MFRDLLNRYQLNLDDKKKYSLIFLLIFLSLFSTEVVYQYFITRDINYVLAVVSALFFSGVTSLLYLIIPKIRYVLLIILGVIYNLIILLFSIIYDITGFIPTLEELSYSSVIDLILEGFKFNKDYLLYLIPIILLVLVPRKFKLRRYPLLKVSINYLAVPYIALVFCSLIPYRYLDTTHLEKFFNTRNNNFVSYQYGAMLSLINHSFVTEEDLTNYEIDQIFSEDTVPNSGYNSKQYQGKNFILIDAMGLDYAFINEEVMPFLNTQLVTSTHSVNFYSVPTPIKEQAYFMMDTGLYYDSDNPYNISYGYKSVRNHNLTKLFSKNGYKTTYYTNDNDSSYRYGNVAGFDDVNYYDTNSLTVVTEALKSMTLAKPFYTKITLSNKNVDTYQVEERFKGEDELVSRYKGHMDEISLSIYTIFNHLLNNQLLDKTIICIFNSEADTRLYNYVNSLEKDNSRASLDFYKTPLIFLDGGNSENYVYSSFVDFYSGICDAFNLIGSEIEKTSGLSIFHNPFKTIRFMDGSIASEEFIYYAKFDEYKVKKLQYLTPATEDIMKNKIKYSDKMYKLSQNIQKNFYFHLNSV